MKDHLRYALLAATSLAVSHQPLWAADHSVVEFNPAEAKELDWRVVNDGVMGGLSKGNLKVSDEGILTFQGTLSLENNGGFSSIRTTEYEGDLSDADGLLVRTKGDGRTYQLRLYTDARYRGNRVSFKADFETEKGEWAEVKVPFDRFVGSFHGRLLKDEVLDPAKIEGLGILLADKNPGKFDLKVDWIRSFGGDDGEDLVSTALADGRFGTLAKALTEAGLVETLQGEGPFTIFAPTDEAFAKLPEGTVASLLKPENREKLQGILKSHVLSGATGLAGALATGEATTVQGNPISIRFSDGQVMVNDAKLLNADISCSNGVIHVIDSVILPPEPANDLAGVAKRAGQFKTLLAAVEAAGLSEALTGEKPLTVFAPTDQAFAALPEGTLDRLLKEENRDQLKAILALHVVPGKVSAGDALNAGSTKALSGETLSFAITDGVFKVNGATIKSTDVTCDNGVIHVIDTVLLPSDKGEKKKSGPQAAIEEIEKAIDRGVPAFNEGNPEKCARIYRDCMVTISSQDGLDAQIGRALGQLVQQADQIEDETHRAWVLRGGLDRLHALLSGH